MQLNADISVGLSLELVFIIFLNCVFVGFISAVGHQNIHIVWSVIYILCVGLGKTLSGRVEPVQAVVLPKGSSLGICSELTQRKTASAIAKDNPASRKPKAKKRKASTSTRCNVFDFLNSKLGDRDQSASHSSSSSVTGAEAYRGGKSTKRSLNVRLFQATEKVAQVEREIKQLTKSLSRRNGRYTLLTFFAPGQLSSLFLIISVFLDITLTSVAEAT